MSHHTQRWLGDADIVIDGTLLIDWLLKGITVRADHYGATLQHLRNAIKAKRPVMLSHRIILLHANARPHSARTTHEKLQHYQWEFLLHKSYSPDLPPL